MSINLDMSCLRMGLLSRRNMVDSIIVLFVSFLITTTLLCFEVVADSDRRPEVKQVTYRVKPVEILGESLTIAEFDIESSQDLYYTEGLPCRPKCAKSRKQAGKNCDLSKPGCEGAPKNSSHCPRRILCEEVYYDWDRLEPDREYENIIIAQNTPSFFRFHWTEDCKAFQVILKLNYGQVAYFLNSPSSPSPKPPAYDNHNLYFRTKLELDNNPVVVCPSSSGFELGTWTIGIYAYTSKANFSLEIRSYDVRTLEQRDLLPSAKPSKKCRPHSPEHICIGTDSASRFSLPDPSASQTEDVAALFQVTVEECIELHIWTELIEAAPGWNSFDPIKDSNALDIWVMAIGGENDPFPDTRNNTYGPTANYWALGGDTFIEVCPERGKGSTNLFVGIWASFNSTYWLFVETYRTSWNRVPISRLYDNTYFNLATLFGSASIQCHDDVQFICNPASLIGYDSCFQFFPYLSNPFARMPTPIRLLSDFYREVNPIHEETVTSDLRVSDKTISFALILQLGTTVYFPEWQKRLHSCNMILPSFSPISSTSGKRLLGSKKVQKKESQCDNEDFRAVSEVMDGVLRRLINSNNTFSDALTYRYEMDSLAARDVFFACKRYVSQYLDKERTSKLITSSNCYADPESEEFRTSPCCNDTLAWSQCCAERLTNFTKTTYVVDNREVTRTCGASPECVEDLLEQYAFIRPITEERRCGGPFRQNTRLIQIEDLVKQLEACSSRTFGSGTQRLQCWDDFDCLSGQCDPISRECLLATDPVNLFWKCVQDILTGDDQLRVDLFFRNITAEEGAGLLQEEFNRLDECLTDSGASLTYHPRYSRVSLWADCEVPGKQICLDDGCSLPVRYSGQVLSGRIGTGCDYVWFWNDGEEGLCTKEKTCNWDQTIQDKQACEEAHDKFCGFCPGFGEDCVVAPFNDRKSCENSFACFRHDGSVTFTQSAENCDQSRSCNATCNGSPCESRSECESNTVGSCSSDILFNYFQLVNDLEDPIPYVCIRPDTPYNSPDCDDYLLGIVGSPFAAGCPYYDGNLCARYGGKILHPPTSKQECEEVLSPGCDDQPTSLLSPKSKEECEKCASQMVQRLTWSSGTWEPSIPKPLKWTQKEYVPVNKLKTSINFPGLLNRFRNAKTVALISTLQTESFCRYSATKSYINRVSCTCLGELDVEKCLDEPPPTIGAGRYCRGFKTVVAAPPATMTVEADALEEDKCIVLLLDLIPKATFNNFPEVEISSTFYSKPRDGSLHEAVKNKNGAIVGEIISSGVGITGGEELEGFLLCIDLLSFGEDEDLYPVLDFAIPHPSSSDWVLPLQVKVKVERDALGNDLLCGSIVNPKGIIDQSGNAFGDGLVIMPVRRTKNWRSDDPSQLEPGEKVSFIIMACVFFIAAVLGIHTGYVIMQGTDFKIRTDTSLIVKVTIAILSTALFIRFWYLILSGTGAVYFFDHNIAEYVLVELPFFLFACTFVLVALAFFYSVMTLESKPLTLNKHVWLPFGITTILLLAFFAVIVIIFNHLDSTSLDLTTCGPLVISYTRKDTLNIVRVIYRAIFSGFISIISAGLFAIGVHMARAAGKKKMRKPYRMLFLVGTVGACSLASGIFFIVFYLTIPPSPYITWVLLPTEVLPSIVIFLHMMGPKLLRQSCLAWIWRSGSSSGGSTGRLSGMASRTTSASAEVSSS